MEGLEGPEYVLVDLVKEVLKDASKCYLENKQFSQEIFESLNSIFGEVALRAFDLVDRCKFIKYVTKDKVRSNYKIISRKHNYFIYEGINYCSCQWFEQQVLIAKEFMTCEHVLALEIAKIVGKIKTEELTPGQMIELLNNQINIVYNNFEV